MKIFCHICNEELLQWEYYKGIITGSREVNWECPGGGHLCIIVTANRRRCCGQVKAYSALMPSYNKILHSEIDGSAIYDKEFGIIEYLSQERLVIPKFFPINLKLPLLPQFDKLYNKIKVYTVFS